MACQLRNLIYYLPACYTYLSYSKGIGSEIGTIDKANEPVYRNAFNNGAMTHTPYKFMNVLSTDFS